MKIPQRHKVKKKYFSMTSSYLYLKRQKNGYIYVYIFFSQKMCEKIIEDAFLWDLGVGVGAGYRFPYFHTTISIVTNNNTVAGG